MKNFVTSILLLVFVQASGQNNDLTLTLSFENTEIINVLNQIENKINISKALLSYFFYKINIQQIFKNIIQGE